MQSVPRIKPVAILLLVSMLLGTSLQSHASELLDGKALFAQHCASCHNASPAPRVPSSFTLSRSNPRAILMSLQTGVMRPQGAALSEAQQIALVETLTGKTLQSLEIPKTAWCPTTPAPLTDQPTVHWHSWGGDERGNGHANAADARLTSADLPALQVQWAFAIPGASSVRGVPTLIDDVLYLNSSGGGVFALDRHSGCIYWHLETSAAVRGGIGTGPSLDPKDSAPTLYFTTRTLQVWAVNARTGEAYWQQRVSQHPLNSNTGGTLYHEGSVYIPVSSVEVGVAGNPKHACCTSSGGVIAIDARTGAERWRMLTTGREATRVGTSADGMPEFAPSGAPVWASPTLDAKRGLLYIGTGENYSRPATLTSDATLALRISDGQIVWQRQGTADDAWHIGCDRMPDRSPCDDPGPDLDFGMSPIITTLKNGQQRLFAGQKSAMVFAYDPDAQGKPLWATRVGKGGALGGIHWGIASDGERVYVTNNDRPAVLKDVNPEDKLAPGLYALDAMTGALVWSVPTPGERCETYDRASRRERGACLAANSAAPVVAGDLVFAGDLNGVLRAHDAATGRILWTFDSDREFDTINGVTGRGGSIDGPAPVVHDGQVFVSSGYSAFGQKPGNVFIALGRKAPSAPTAR